jgi:hypothetical protein
MQLELRLEKPNGELYGVEHSIVFFPDDDDELNADLLIIDFWDYVPRPDVGQPRPVILRVSAKHKRNQRT